MREDSSDCGRSVAHQPLARIGQIPAIRSSAIAHGAEVKKPVQPSTMVPPVLVIDDDPALLHSLASVFEAHGIAVVTARDGLEGLAKFRRIRPALVLTDIIMPEKDGIGTIMTMRRERPSMQIVAMSGGGRVGKSDFLTIAKMLGANAVMPKPLDIDAIVGTIRRHLAGRD